MITGPPVPVSSKLTRRRMRARIIRSPSSASAMNRARSRSGRMSSASTAPRARTSTRPGRPLKCASSPVKPPGLSVMMTSPSSPGPCWMMSALPDRMTFNPGLAAPAVAIASAAPYDRGSPKRRRRSTSDASSTGNIWSRRVSMRSAAGAAIIIHRRGGGSGRKPRAALLKSGGPDGAACFEQEPGASLSLVDPDFQQARGRNIVMLVAQPVRLAQARGELLVVVTQLGEHVIGRDEIGVVVENTLQTPDMADRAQRGAADLADALGERVRGGEDLIALLVEQQMVVAEVRPGNMPMKILGLQVQREHVGQQPVERAGDVADGVGFEVGGGFERGDPSDLGITSSHMSSP